MERVSVICKINYDSEIISIAHVHQLIVPV